MLDLRCCDNTDPRRGLPSLADKSVDHVITDPPYGDQVHEIGMRSASAWKGGPRERQDIGFDAMGDRVIAAAELVRVCRGWIVLFCDLESMGLWRDAFNAAGARFKRAGVWVKLNCAPQFNGQSPAQGAEGIAIAWAGKDKSSWNGRGRPAVWTFPIVLERGNGTVRYHPTQKPLELMEALVQDFTSPGDLILDPWMGSGTTGIACLREDRRFVGMERERKHFETAEKRAALMGGTQIQLFGGAKVPRKRRVKEEQIRL